MQQSVTKTSVTDPLRIDKVACGGGQIGMTFCPGKRGPSDFGGVWHRDLAADLGVIHHWQADAVITLMEASELARHGVGELGAAVERLGMDWHHLPIVDLRAPGPDFERRWTYSGQVLARTLATGGKVLIHCRGGRGRTGSIAARLLVDFGSDPGAAITEVRAARHGTIERPCQEEWVRALSPGRGFDPNRDRILGCLFGGAVGDAFGYAIEFSKLPAIRATYGPFGLEDPIFRNGRLIVSDDTQMTLFTAQGVAAALAAGELDDNRIIEAIRAAYMAWYETQTVPFSGQVEGADLRRYRQLWVNRHSGLTCISAMASGGHGAPERPLNSSKGCGGVMRVAPIGLVEAWGADRAFALAGRAAALTHGHPCGWLSAAALAAIVSELIGGASLSVAYRSARRLLTGAPHNAETLRYFDAALAMTQRAIATPDAYEKLGQGWVGEEALAIAIWAAHAAEDSFRELVRIAANHDGDSDSTASIAGQIWGAGHGLAGMPHAWIRRLDVFDPLCEVAAALFHGQRITSIR